MQLLPEFYDQGAFQPAVKEHYDLGWIRKTTWNNIFNRDGSLATFTSRWYFGHLQYYSGTAKCDGTKSYESLAQGRGYVMTDKPSELKAFRWRADGPGELKWDNMGGS